MRFQVEIYPEKYQLDQMQNGQLEGIIDFNMGNIGKTMPASKTISIEQIKKWRTGGVSVIYMANCAR